MSYDNPIIKSISNPVGIDLPIEDIRTELKDGLPWLEKSFGRAWEFSEKRENGRVVKVPKVYQGEGEYLNVLPNDNLKSYSFIMCDGPEEWEQFTKGLSNPKKRKLVLIFWFNLSRLSVRDEFSIEHLKRQVEAVLKKNAYVASVDRYFDEKAEDVFRGYINSGSGSMSTVDDDVSQYCMWPYNGMRFEITVNYFDNC